MFVYVSLFVCIVCIYVCMHMYMHANACIFSLVYVNDVCRTMNVWRYCMFGIYVFQIIMYILQFLYIFLQYH